MSAAARFSRYSPHSSSSGHWFAIRKVHGVWWNLNSLDPVMCYHHLALSALTCGQDCPSKMGSMYLDMFLAQLVAGGSSVFAAIGPLPSPLPPFPDDSSSLAPANTPAPAFSGVGHSLKQPSYQKPLPASPVDDDLNVAMAMSMLSTGPLALKIAIVSPNGTRQVS